MLGVTLLCYRVIRRRLSAMSVAGGAYLLGESRLKAELLDQLGPHLEEPGHVLRLPQQLSLRFLRDGDDDDDAGGDESSSVLRVLVDAAPSEGWCELSPAEYYGRLRTEHLGRVVLLAERLPSCLNVAHPGAPLPHGFTVVALEQTRGVGRAGNAWESPRGCAMFALQLHLDRDSYLGTHATLLQHLVALAVVRGGVPPGLDLRLKWPNDVYYGDLKVGGVTVASSTSSSVLVCSVGCGLNLSNTSPTTCLDQVVSEHNRRHGTSLQRPSLGGFLAAVLTELEALVARAQAGHVADVIQLYYDHWMHTGAQVHLPRGGAGGGGHTPCTVVGIDEYGFLQVRDQQSGRCFSLHGLDNSYDIRTGRITPKNKQTPTSNTG